MFRDILENSHTITILTHKNPDGDTFGSALGLYFVLKKVGKKVTIINKSIDIQRELKYIKGFDKIKNITLKKSDLFIALDGANINRFGLDENELELIRSSHLLNIDHHITNTNFGNTNIIDSSSCATALVVYKLLKESEYKIDKESAEALFFGIASDSGFFGFERVDSNTFRVGAELCDLGVNPNDIYNALKNGNSLSKIRLLQKGLDSLSLHSDGRCGIMILREEDFKSSGAFRSDCDGLVNYPLSISCVKLAILLRKERDSDEVRISFRSKESLDTNLIANKFDGGGHINASGATVKNRKIEDIKSEILKYLEGFFDG